MQSRAGVSALEPVAPELVAAQIAAARASGQVRAVKVGALANGAVVRAVAVSLADADAPIVVDPVLAASGGFVLLDDDGRRALVSDLLPRAALVTPNLAEAAALVGARVTNRAEMRDAAHALVAEVGAAAVLVKGGHLAGDAPADLFVARGGGEHWLIAPRIAGVDLHGTGCALSSAVAAGLARGDELLAAIHAAREYVRELLEHGSALPGAGRALADHLAPMRARTLRGDRDDGIG